MSHFSGKGAGQNDMAPVEKFGFGVNTCCGYIAQVKKKEKKAYLQIYL